MTALPCQGVLLDYLTPSNTTILPLLRALRVLRVVKIVPQARGVRMLLLTLLWSVPALVNVGAVLLLTMFVYVSNASHKVCTRCEPASLHKRVPASSRSARLGIVPVRSVVSVGQACLWTAPVLS